MRIAAMMGIVPFSVKRPRIVTIGSPSPLHDSYRLPLSMDIGLYHYHMLPATTPVEELVKKLNILKPDLLRGFPSMLGLLASEQLQSRLQINPRFIAGGGEALTEEMRQQLKVVWPKSAVFDIYGTQEGIRSMECSPGGGMHLFEDLGIIEVVDEHNRPVPDGSLGHKILFTNLFSFTLPIIRYEISDMVTLDTEPCSCGRPFRRISQINGRNDDVIYLKSRTGDQVAVHPVQFWDVLESFREIRQYQVVQECDGIYLHLVLDNGNEAVIDSIRERLGRELQALGVSKPAIHVKPAATLGDRSGNMGKWKNIISNLNQTPP